MDIETLRQADAEQPAAEYIKGVPGTVGELVKIIDAHGIDGVEAAPGIGPVTADAIRRALADDSAAGHNDWTPSASYHDGDRVQTPEGDIEAIEDVSLAAELQRRHRAGESHVAMAEAYGLMPSRVAQIIREG